MAEPEYVSYDKYRADLADFRADMSRFREEMRTDMAEMRTEVRTGFAGIDVRMAQLEMRLMRWMLVAAGLGGVVGGLIAAVARLFTGPPGS